MSPDVALDIAGVSKIFGRSVALRPVTLHVARGETLALLGANGSGKTTLLKIAAGALTPTAGTVLLDGHDLSREKHLRRSRIGMLSSETYLYDDLTAVENLRFVSTMAGRVVADEILTLALRRVRLEAHAAQRVRTFSSGMKRRLSVARVQVLGPDVVLLDEPYNSLDAQGADLVDEWIGEVAAHGGIVIVATHDAERALTYAQSVAVLQRGTLVYAGAASEYGNRPAHHVG
jgi:heme ABC exporter ATP-binding subunit CcmA